MRDGPVATAHSILQGMGWYWQAPTLFTREELPHLGLLDGPESWWLHEIRQGLRLAEWRKAGTRRGGMRGIESTAGIDKVATTKVMNSTKIPPEQRNGLRELLGGCVWTHKKQFDSQRAELIPSSDRDRLTWPLCTSRYGIFLEDPESVAWAGMELGTRAHSISCNTLPDCPFERFESETKNNDSVVAWTVGACVCNQYARFRRVGCGVFIGINGDRNCSFTLPGREQRNNRADLLAVIAAMQIHDGNLEIRTSGETQKGIEGNTDLWDEFETKLRLYATRRLDLKVMRRSCTSTGVSPTTSLNKGRFGICRGGSSRSTAGIDRGCYRKAANSFGHAQFRC